MQPETTPIEACPFKPGAGVALADLPSIVRVGDRLKFYHAVEQLKVGILAALDLDEARSQMLTFLAVVTAATLEMGGTRAMHRIQLSAARELETLSTREAIVEAGLGYLQQIAEPFFVPLEGPSAHLVDRALATLERHYAKALTDEIMAHELGLSTSHFRSLFRKATGHPFHRYLMSLRLEKAKGLLQAHPEMPVAQVASRTGFSSLPHFSRAFHQRFSVSPTHLRRLGT